MTGQRVRSETRGREIKFSGSFGSCAVFLGRYGLVWVIKSKKGRAPIEELYRLTWRARVLRDYEHSWLVSGPTMIIHSSR